MGLNSAKSFSGLAKPPKAAGQIFLESQTVPAFFFLATILPARDLCAEKSRWQE
jgi:hypothetical protein